MNDNGFCEYYPKKCRWDCHKNKDYILEDVMEDKTVTLDDLKKDIMIVKMNYLLKSNYSKEQKKN